MVDLSHTSSEETKDEMRVNLSAHAEIGTEAGGHIANPMCGQPNAQAASTLAAGSSLSNILTMNNTGPMHITPSAPAGSVGGTHVDEASKRNKKGEKKAKQESGKGEGFRKKFRTCII